MLKTVYYLIIALLTCSGGIFYFWQNSDIAIGGTVALPKVIWLGFVVWFWYFLPLLIYFDQRVSKTWRNLYGIFWLNMLLRAIIELVMMYFGHNWHPNYGIAHDLFSAVLVGGLLFTHHSIHQPNHVHEDSFFHQAIRSNFQIIGALFLIEAYFAYYMLNNVHLETGVAYFVPDKPEYQGIMLVTWLVIISLTIQQVLFAKNWLHGYQSLPQTDNP